MFPQLTQSMFRIFLISTGVLVLLLSSCSTETWQRAGYETVKNIGKQQCQKSATTECQRTGDYPTYQGKRKALESTPQ